MLQHIDGALVLWAILPVAVLAVAKTIYLGVLFEREARAVAAAVAKVKRDMMAVAEQMAQPAEGNASVPSAPVPR